MSIRVLNDTLNTLRAHFLWPEEGQELHPSLKYYLKYFVVQIICLVIPVGSVLHLIMSIKLKTFDFFEDLYMLIAIIGAYYFLANFVYFQKDIAQIFIDLSNFETFGKPANFDETQKFLLLASRVYKRSVNLAAVCFCLPPFILKRFCLKNDNKQVLNVCGIVVKAWMPWDIQSTPSNEILAIWQSFSAIMILCGAAFISCAICETMEYLIIKIQHVKSLLQEAIDFGREDLIKKVVQYQTHTYSIGDRMDNCYSNCLFLHLLFSGALFGCIAYELMSFGVNAKGLALLLAWFNSLLVVSISGQRLIDETLSIGDVAYNSKWYERSPKFRKQILFIMARSRKPVVVHAGPFSYLSHLIILSVLKTAYSYLTLLATTTS